MDPCGAGPSGNLTTYILARVVVLRPPHVEDFVEYVSQTQRRLASMRQLLGPRRKQPGVSYKPWYCPGPGRLGFYNNWFVTKISWWLEDHRVAACVESSRRWRITG